MFSTFWQQYPRKVAKKEAEKAWLKMTEEARQTALQALPAHIRYWEASQTDKMFIPHPATWLRGERYEDELEMPQPKKEVTPGWWATEKATLEMGQKLGLVPGRGEDWNSFRNRIRERIAA